MFQTLCEAQSAYLVEIDSTEENAWVNERVGTGVLRTYDTFPTFSLETFFQPPPFEKFLEIDFQFSMVSILQT
jgi:fluoride ion exporter CrcB/FEX